MSAAADMRCRLVCTCLCYAVLLWPGEAAVHRYDEDEYSAPTVVGLDSPHGFRNIPTYTNRSEAESTTSGDGLREGLGKQAGDALVADSPPTSVKVVGASSSREPELVDFSCRASDPMPVLPFGTPEPSQLREIIWGLKLRHRMPIEEADKLLNLESSAGDDANLRATAAAWIQAKAEAHRCRRPAVCLWIARQLDMPSDAGCPTGTMLIKAHHELEEPAATILKGSKAVEVHRAAQEQVLKLAETLSKPDYDGDDSIIGEREATLMQKSMMDKAQAGDREVLDSFQKIVTQHGSGLLQAFRLFLADLAAGGEAERGAGAVAESKKTQTQAKMLGLLRLRTEQRQSLTIEGLAREAAVLALYEPWVQTLEVQAAKLFSNHRSDISSTAGHVDEEDFEPIQLEVERLSNQLKLLADDIELVLPGDGGIIPSFWQGRCEKVRRAVVDRLLGRAKARPTVLVFTCSYGGGHLAATTAIKGYLRDKYNVVVVNPSKDKEFYEGDLIGDFIRRFVEPKWDMTYMYNELVLRRKEYALESAVENFQTWTGWMFGNGTRFDSHPCPAPGCDSTKKHLLRRALLRTHPDAVITVYHHHLFPILELCAENGLPIVHLGTDIDTKMQEVFNAAPGYPSFRLGLPFNLQQTWSTVSPIPTEQAFVSGYPVRAPFLEPLPSRSLLHARRLERRIPMSSWMALVMSGSGGQDVPWPAMLLNSKTWSGPPLHVIVVAGSNGAVRGGLEGQFHRQDSFGHRVVMHGASANISAEVAREPSTSENQNDLYISAEELVRLMDMADVLITKAGGSTSAEAAYRGLPVLFDATDGMLPWEERNARVFEDHKRGLRLFSADELESRLSSVIAMGRNPHRVFVNDVELADSQARIREQVEKLLTSAVNA